MSPPKLPPSQADLPATSLAVRRIGIDTQHEPVVYMHIDCPVCRSEGFVAHARVRLNHGSRMGIATLHKVTGDLITPYEAALSESAWLMLDLSEGDQITVSHPAPLESLSAVRGKIYGHPLDRAGFGAIMNDIVRGRYSDIHTTSFITACAARPLNSDEIVALTGAMVDAGQRLTWDGEVIVDKHCVGGLPGNRITPIVVSIVAALGLIMPKTSSRAITSPAGTADTMETLAPVDLSVEQLRRVVEQEGGCIAWGGSMQLSPADDLLIRIERAIDIDSEGQLIASVLSKKIAAGSTHVVLDLPVGRSAKVRDRDAAERLSAGFSVVAQAHGLQTRTVVTDGRQPVGRGIGPALEARDVLAVLQGDDNAPADLRERAVDLAGAVLELGGAVPRGSGVENAMAALADGSAWRKFQRICEAQGGMRTPPVAAHSFPLNAVRSGRIAEVDNRKLARLAKLAGAPAAKASGVELLVRLEDSVAAGQPLCLIHAETDGELSYALNYAMSAGELFMIKDHV
jgi:thymidine phosphorylase